MAGPQLNPLVSKGGRMAHSRGTAEGRRQLRAHCLGGHSCSLDWQASLCMVSVSHRVAVNTEVRASAFHSIRAGQQGQQRLTQAAAAAEDAAHGSESETADKATLAGSLVLSLSPRLGFDALG